MALFSPLKLRGLTIRNRAWISPMCQYSAVDGVPQPWHLVHLGARAAGGAGLVIAEATGIEPEGRITLGCTGIWNDEQVAAWSGITAFIKKQGAVPGIQIAHAGRKASTYMPNDAENGSIPLGKGGWVTKAPDGRPFGTLASPKALTIAEIRELREKWVAAAKRALAAGFEVLEIHAAHGYLFHQFLSPLSNSRTDEYGGSFENRTRFLLETVAAVRAAWPENLPLFVRLSTTDWVEGGWNADESVALARLLLKAGVDLIDCSSGGATPDAKVPVAPGYQVANATRIRREAGIPVGAVGVITDAHQAENIVESGEADAVLIARASLDDPNWPAHAAEALGVAEVPYAPQYAWVRKMRPLPKK